MEANKLMIGDWVKFPIGNEKIVDLPYIEGRGICASFAASATLFPVEVDKLEPIPITAEILEKNGWLTGQFYSETLLNGWQIQWDGATVRMRKGEYYEVCISIQYVHELQHVFRLCGIDKTIEL